MKPNSMTAVFTLSVDNTVKVVTVPPGKWLIYGHATQTYLGFRRAKTAAGAIADGELAAPATLPAAVPNAAAGKLYGTGLAQGPAGTASGSAAAGAFELSTSTSTALEFTVGDNEWMNVYMTCGSSSAPKLVGPFDP